jgi:uncharacterized protein (TIGR02646 family)
VKYIAKGAEPASLINWKQGQIDAGIEPRWAQYQNPEKGDGRKHLLAEQGDLCCYCNRRISSSDMHIEHFMARRDHEELELEWINLLGCCSPQNLKGKKVKNQRHCGENRGHKALPFGPLDPTCETRIGYKWLGAIEAEPSTDVDAAALLQTLNLHAERLRKQREELIRLAYADVELLPEEVWLDVYVRQVGGQLPEFSGMMDWFYRNGWDKELQAAAADAF